MAAKYKLRDVAQLAGRGIFFDANVLIYLFWPTGSHYSEKKYATTFMNLLRQKNPLYVDFLVISEVVNRILRIEHKKLNCLQNFKDFRNSDEGKEALADIYVIVKNEILNRFKVAGKSFTDHEIESFLTIDELDFVDKATVLLCKENNFVILTNDRDFKNADLDILTGNSSILS